MTDTVQVPREATSEMMQAGLEAMRTENVRDTSENGRCACIYAAMIAAAPQATDPRERHILITPDRSHVEIRDMGHAMTLLAEQNIAIDSLQSRIATLTAERDALREELDSLKKLRARARQAIIDDALTMPSKTE